MPKKTATIHIKWVRSGIGFSRKQEEVVRSIGLRRLNQVVERPDTVQFRGLVAKVSHLVEIVEPPSSPAWRGVPEYKIVPAEAKAKAPTEKKVAEAAAAEAPVETVTEAAGAAPPQKESAAPKKRAAKSPAKDEADGSEKPKPKRKAAAPKPADKDESKSKKGKK